MHFSIEIKIVYNIFSCSVEALKTVYFGYSKTSLHIFVLIITVSVKFVHSLLLVFERMAMAKDIL